MWHAFGQQVRAQGHEHPSSCAQPTQIAWSVISTGSAHSARWATTPDFATAPTNRICHGSFRHNFGRPIIKVQLASALDCNSAGDLLVWRPFGQVNGRRIGIHLGADLPQYDGQDAYAEGLELDA